MAATPFKPVTWTTDVVTKQKLQDMSNNDQWLFENMPRIRYSSSGITKDTGVKIISGKTIFTVTNTKQSVTSVQFGSFFTIGSRPTVTFSIQGTGGHHHALQGVTQALAGRGEIDHTGFLVVISTASTNFNISQPGWIHWTAVGY